MTLLQRQLRCRQHTDVTPNCSIVHPISANQRTSPAPRADSKAAGFHAEVAQPQQHKGIGTAEVNPNTRRLDSAATGSHTSELDPAPNAAIAIVPDIVSDDESTLTAGRRRGDFLARSLHAAPKKKKNRNPTCGAPTTTILPPKRPTPKQHTNMGIAALKSRHHADTKGEAMSSHY
jgi:hypothetical protein